MPAWIAVMATSQQAWMDGNRHTPAETAFGPECAFGADDETGEVVAGRGFARAPRRRHQLAVGQHYFHRQ
jgi:hypothetical protein